jgi:hypothetical protein
MKRGPQDDAGGVTRLSTVLEAHRERLARLPGVIGTGVGLASSSRAGDARVAIQIFVTLTADVTAVQRLASEIVGPEDPVEVVPMSVPRADTGETGTER